MIAEHFVHSGIDRGCSRKRPICRSIETEYPSLQDVKHIKSSFGALNLIGCLTVIDWDIDTVVPIWCQCRKATSGSGHIGHYPVLRLEKQLGKMARHGPDDSCTACTITVRSAAGTLKNDKQKQKPPWLEFQCQFCLHPESQRSI